MCDGVRRDRKDVYLPSFLPRTIDPCGLENTGVHDPESPSVIIMCHHPILQDREYRLGVRTVDDTVCYGDTLNIVGL